MRFQISFESFLMLQRLPRMIYICILATFKNFNFFIFFIKILKKIQTQRIYLIFLIRLDLNVLDTRMAPPNVAEFLVQPSARLNCQKLKPETQNHQHFIDFDGPVQKSLEGRCARFAVS